jgi:hypothetical protein
MDYLNKKQEGTTRRDFVKQAAAGIAGVTVTGARTPSRAAAAPAPQAPEVVEVVPGIMGPKNGKYAKYVRPFVFQNYLPGPLRTATKADGLFLGHDVCIEYGVFAYAGRVEESHVHDFDQVLFFFGGDCNDLGELSAECELFLGPEKEKTRIASTTAVFLPKGFPHGPLVIKGMDRRFFYMQVSMQRENKGKPGPAGPESTAPPPMFGGKYRDRIVQPNFVRKAPGSYGPLNPDDSGGALASITSPKNEFATLMMVESIKKAPYRFGPQPDKPHTHTQPEFLSFIGADPYDPASLGGEVECYMGPEGNQERYIFTVPVMWIVPAELPHLPLIITKVDKPLIMSDCRPFGSGAMGAPAKF